MSELEDLDPEEEQVRRLLADARHSAPIPDDVAARLDTVLADLRDEDPEAPAPVVASQRPTDLAAARRRHNVRSWLVAAAAVVVVGFGINQVTQMDVSGDDDSGSSADTAGSGESVQRPGKDNDKDGGDQGAGDGAEAPSSSSLAQDPAAIVAPVRLHSTRFGTQVKQLRNGANLSRTNGALIDGTQPAPPAENDLDSAYSATCPARGWGRGTAVPVRYDRQPGVLVFRQVRGDTQVVDLFLCGSDHPERSITLPAP